MSEYIIETRNLRKVYDTNDSKVAALNGIEMKVKRGETVGVMGVSGSGKSTLLHVLGTLDRPTEGDVIYDGEEIFARTDQELAYFRNRELGFVFQFHYLLPEFSALENVLMPGLIGGMERREMEESAVGMLERVGLGARLSHRPGELSGGEQQRVAIARACVLRPRVILADEPTGNLDQDTGSSIMDLFLQLNEEYGITIVLVSHDVTIAVRLDRRIRLLDGKIIDEN
ncbi:MAG: ABC transporter ATP-binding protein [Candidatus Dadabacteria bacterium]|nr:ABC transporter ATP-binding protein [Candidatus Dadabacteria bacterium]